MLDNHYDYIICGAGCAGLSLAMGLAEKEFHSKKILLLDRDDKTSNDRTWSYWERGEGRYDSILYKSWDRLEVNFKDWSKVFDISPFRYKTIRGIDFYHHAKNIVDAAKHIDFQLEEIVSIEAGKVKTNNSSYTADWVFSSIPMFEIKKTRSNFVNQHFGGWWVRSEKPIFQPDTVGYMDFRIAGSDECKFGYVLPSSKTEALVEIASFSNDVLSMEQYEVQLRAYISDNYGNTDYEINEKEYNVIPMTTIAFEKNNTEGLTFIGVFGGASKASTGYAFDRIQRHINSITDQLKRNGIPNKIQRPVSSKHRWFDHIFLDVLLQNRYPMPDVFSRIFKKVPVQDVLDFLSDQSTLVQDLKVIMSCPKWPFIKGMLLKR